MNHDDNEMSAASLRAELKDWATTILAAVAVTFILTLLLFMVLQIVKHRSHTTAKAVMYSHNSKAVKPAHSPTLDTRLKGIEMRLTQIQGVQLQQEKGR